MKIVVQKYGGTSLATPKHIQRAARRIRSLKESGAQVVVVASAMGHMTDHLLKLARKTVAEPPSRELDMLLTAGERISMSLLAMCLQSEGIPAISFTGSQSGIITTNDHTQAKIIEIRAHRIREELAKGKVVIIAGFQGVSEQKEITTLGRGGSDTTAVAIAAELKADRCEILTDVDGLYTADPRVVPEATVIPSLDYDVALELAYRGAKLHARSVELAKQYGVRLWMAGSREDCVSGTEISKNITEDKSMTKTFEKSAVTGIATKDNLHFFEVNSPIEHLNGLPASIHFFQSREKSAAFLVESDDCNSVKKYLTETGFSYRDVPNVTLVSAVGEGIRHAKGILQQFLSALKTSGTEALLIGSDSLSLFAAIAAKQKTTATQAIHSALITEGTDSLS